MPFGYVAAAKVVVGALTSDAPDTSGMNDAAAANAQLSREALDWEKERYKEEAPARQKAIDLATKTAEQQIKIADQNAAISKDYDEYQKGTFRPLEQGIVKAAQEYDTPERRELKAGQAIAGVNSQVDNARAAMRDRMSSRGIDLGSGNVVAQEAAMAVQGGAAAAAAANGARDDVEIQGNARKMDAASLGRGLASNQATSAGVALNAGNSAVNNGQVPVTIGNNATAQVASGIQQAIGANQSAGSLYGQAASIDSATRGQNISALTSAYGSYMKSDEDVKSGTGKPVNTAAALGAILKTPVDQDWHYDPAKGGPDDGGLPHTGPMAQDIQKNMGDDVAPGGKNIDIVSMNGILMAGIQELAKEVKTLKKTRRQPAAAQGVM